MRPAHPAISCIPACGQSLNLINSSIIQRFYVPLSRGTSVHAMNFNAMSASVPRLFLRKLSHFMITVKFPLMYYSSIGARYMSHLYSFDEKPTIVTLGKDNGVPIPLTADSLKEIRTDELTTPVVHKKKLPENFVGETLLPHLEDQIIRMTPSFSVTQLGEVGAAYSRLPQELRVKEVENLLLERMGKAIVDIHTSHEAMSILSVLEQLCLTDSLLEDASPNLIQSIFGSSKHQKALSYFLSMRKCLQKPLVSLGLSVLNLFAISRVYSKLLRAKCLPLENKKDIESFTLEVRKRMISDMSKYDSTELYDIVRTIAAYSTATIDAGIFDVEKKNSGVAEKHADHDECKDLSDPRITTNRDGSKIRQMTLGCLTNTESELSLIPIVLRFLDKHIEENRLSFFHIMSLLHLLRKCGIRHEMLLRKCISFLKGEGVGIALNSGLYKGGEADSTFGKSKGGATVISSISDLKGISQEEAEKFAEDLMARLRDQDERRRSQSGVDLGDSNAQWEPTVVDTLPPTLLAKTAWTLRSLGVFEEVERELEKPIVRNAKFFGPVDFARLTQALPEGAPVLVQICNFQINRAATFSPSSFLFFVAGILQMRALPLLGKNFELPQRLSTEEGSLPLSNEQLENNKMMLRIDGDKIVSMINKFCEGHEGEFTPLQVRYLLKALEVTAYNEEDFEGRLQLLPSNWRKHIASKTNLQKEGFV